MRFSLDLPVMPSRRAPRHPVAVTPPADSDVAVSDEVLEADLQDAFRRRPRQSRGQKRVELLLNAAASVIARGGLRAATAEAIAIEARTAKGSLYQFFPNREAVLAALAQRYADEMHSIYERALPIDSRALPLERLIDRIVRPLAEFHDHNPAFRRVFAHNDGSVDEAATSSSRLRAQIFESFVDRLDAVFAERNPLLGHRERRRAALISATIGQSLLARRARAPAAEKKPLMDDLRHILFLYLTPLLVPITHTLPEDGTRHRVTA